MILRASGFRVSQNNSRLFYYSTSLNRIKFTLHSKPHSNLKQNLIKLKGTREMNVCFQLREREIRVTKLPAKDFEKNFLLKVKTESKQMHISNETTEIGNLKGWKRLPLTSQEVKLSLCLPTGQTFRWRKTGVDTYTGVIGSHIVSLCQENDNFLTYRFHHGATGVPVPSFSHLQSSLIPRKRRSKLAQGSEYGEEKEEGLVELMDYLNLGISLRKMFAEFSAKDEYFASLAPYVVGARMLRQDPVECLFQFICSSNNHISRIQAMVDKLAGFGTFLGNVEGVNYFQFPSVERIALISEEELRAAGFGYRAKFIINSAKMLLDKPGGPRNWLLSLRNVPFRETVDALCTLPGVGPKVASCVAAFSLDKNEAVPVDTHVWQISLRHYTPELTGKTLTPKLHSTISEAFLQRFGDKAGWALNAMFVAELPQVKVSLPIHLLILPPKSKKAMQKFENL